MHTCMRTFNHKCMITHGVHAHMRILCRLACIHTRIPMYMCTYKQPATMRTCSYRQANKMKQTWTFIHTRIPTYIHADMHTCMHTYIPTYLHTGWRTRTHRCRCTGTCTHTHIKHKIPQHRRTEQNTQACMLTTYIHTCMFKSVHTEGHIKNHKDIQTSIQAYIQTNTYIHACIQIHTHVLTDIHTCMHTYVGIHTYEYMETHATRTHA